jgi:hypothetical protein
LHVLAPAGGIWPSPALRAPQMVLTRVLTGYGRFYPFVFRISGASPRRADRIGKFRILTCRQPANPTGTVIHSEVLLSPHELGEQASAQPGDGAQVH